MAHLSLIERVERLEALLSVHHEVLQPMADVAPTAKTKTADEVVRVIRYVRNYQNYTDVTNLGGFTVLFNIDYNRELVGVWVARCADDENFSKKLGRECVMARFNSTIPKYLFHTSLITEHQGALAALHYIFCRADMALRTGRLGQSEIKHLHDDFDICEPETRRLFSALKLAM